MAIAYKYNILTVFICGVLLLFFLSGCDWTAPRINQLKPGSVILAFGDSLTSGVGAGIDDSYPAILEKIIGCKVINEGVPGELSGQGLARLQHIIDKYQPDLVILCHGGNDLLQRRNERSIVDNLEKMIQIIKDRGIDIVLIGVPTPSLGFANTRFYYNLAKKYNIPYEGSILDEILSNNAHKSDLIHPNAKGYKKLAESIANLIVSSQ
ncbi:MAG: GDSL-type esterase/lipase family protein [Desulfobacterales bacterium]|nr:GDSL-type esterase/lipase family protein [Desulfobacterales bacterium]